MFYARRQAQHRLVQSFLNIIPTVTATDNNSPQQSAVWRRLAEHRQQTAGLRLSEAFAQDPARAQRFSLELDKVFVDFSKNLITDETLSLLLELAIQRGLRQRIGQLLSGHAVNTSERRAALHTLMRAAGTQTSARDNPELSGMARHAREQQNRMFEFARQFRSGEVRGATGKPLSRVVNIGIGGSDLGPRLLVEALCDFRQDGVDVDFVANIDPFDVERTLARADPETTLFVIASKSFTTTETLTNAQCARAWLQQNGCQDSARHLLAVSANADAVARFGIDEERYFSIGEWIGGRYSIWSCIGISAVLSAGADNFRQFLAGAHALDAHFSGAPFSANIPVILGLISVWHNNFHGIGAHAVIPYDQRLERLPAYLSQLVMESNGKSVSTSGGALAIDTSPVIWGGVGTQAQHAVFQFLHQGTRISSTDFLLPLNSDHDARQHELLSANCLAQGEALMQGRTDSTEPHRRLDGNRPSTTILYERLDPYTLGMLLALYEHKTFVEAAIWDVNPFDQWGVELGKTLAGQIADELAGASVPGSRDSSTQQLIDKRRRGRV